MPNRTARFVVLSVAMLVGAGRGGMGVAAPPKGDNPIENVPIDQTQLGDSKFHLVPPPADAWTPATKAGVQNTAAWTSKKRDAIMAIQLLPADFVINDDVIKALIKQLKETRLKS